MKKILFLVLVSFGLKAQNINVASSDLIAVNMGYSTLNPSDGAIYLYGAVLTHSTPALNANRRLMQFPYDVTLVGASITTVTDGTLGSAETSTVSIRINNSNNTVYTAVAFTAINLNYSTTASINIPAGTTFEGAINTPTWVTNPTSTSVQVIFYFRRD